MKVPFMVLSYGNFEQTKKIFSYERDGIHILPIFTDADHTKIFITAMSVVLRRLGDRRPLMTQVCSDQQLALRMFETITVHCPDLLKVIINPTPPTQLTKVLTPEDIQLVEYVRDIDDVMTELQELVSGLDSKA